MTAYTYVNSEPRLWTVGFTKPDGKWEPESDHGTERDAKRRVHELNGVEARYVYWRSEPELWTVGEASGVLYPHSDHSSRADAAAEVIELNA